MTTESSQNSESTFNLDKISIKLPPFWPEKPEIWFYQVEAQFNINNIRSEETKFNYLIAQLEPKYVENIWDIITSTASNRYSLAKERLLNIFKESEEKQLKRLLTGLELGDSKPSQLLRQMQSLGSPDLSSKLLRTLWLEKLPLSIKNILIVSDESLEKLALMADKMLEMTPHAEFCSTDTMTSTISDQAILNKLLLKIEALEKKVETLSLNHQSRSRSQGSSRSRSRSQSHRRFNPKGKFCFFHFKYGNRCREDKCQPPCNWNKQGNASMHQN